MTSLDEVKRLKELEAIDLFRKLQVQEASDYETFNFYNNLSPFNEFSKEIIEDSVKLNWTRLSNSSSLAPTIG